MFAFIYDVCHNDVFAAYVVPNVQFCRAISSMQ
jgi:hypothetical protein